MVSNGKGYCELAKESQASDILKCKAEIFDEFDSNILEVLTGI